jgi:hypothetical protein
MDETPRDTADDDDARSASTRSGQEVLSALRRAASGLEANLREAARLLSRRNPSSKKAA